MLKPIFMNKFKLKLFSWGFLFVCALSAKAQQKYIGVTGGVNWSNAIKTGFVKNAYDRFSYHSGLTFNYMFTNGLQIAADAIYIQKGFEPKIIFTDNQGNEIGTSRILSAYNYVSIPLKVGYTVGTDFCAFVNIGVIPSFLAKARYSFDLPLPAGKQENDLTEYVQKFDLGAVIEIGSSYHLSDNFSVQVRLGYQQSFTTFTTKDHFEGSTGYHNVVLLSSGVQYLLN